MRSLAVGLMIVVVVTASVAVGLIVHFNGGLPVVEVAVESGDGQVTLRVWRKSGHVLQKTDSALTYEYQQRPAGGVFGGWQRLPSKRVVRGLANGWAYSFRVRAGIMRNGEVIFGPASDEVSVVLAQKWPRQRHFEEPFKEEVAARVCFGAEAVISEPVMFGRDTSVIDDDHEGAAAEIVQRFLEDEARLRGRTVHIVGLASGDGERDYNMALSFRRAEAVREMVVPLLAEETAEETGSPLVCVHAWGEEHLTNGVANSRGVRLVRCLEESPRYKSNCDVDTEHESRGTEGV